MTPFSRKVMMGLSRGQAPLVKAQWTIGHRQGS